MAMLPVLLGTIVFGNIQIAVAIAMMGVVTLLAAGIVLNGRDRDNDSEILLKMVEKITGEKQ